MFCDDGRREAPSGGVTKLVRVNEPASLTIDQIRGNIAFEQMVVAVLTGAFSGAAMILALKVIEMIGQGFSLEALLTVALETAFVAMLIFLTGFFASIVLGAPLFAALEQRKRRTFWPYLVAALAAAIIAFAFSVGGLPTLADLRLETLLAIFAPAIIIALTFARLMGPHWRAAERAEAAAAAEPVYFRLH
jgi:hypothetical protein